MPPFLGKNMSPEFEAGKEEGFKIAESYLKTLTKKFYKEVKKGLLERMATTTTTPHSCNCEFCNYQQ